MPPVKAKCPKCQMDGYNIAMHIGPMVFVQGKRIEIASKIKDDIWVTNSGWLIHHCGQVGSPEAVPKS